MCFAKCEPASILVLNKSHLLRNKTIGVSASSLFETIDDHNWTESACTKDKSWSEGTRRTYETQRNTYKTIDIRIFCKDLVETRYWGEENDCIHVIEEGNPGSCQ